VDAIPVNSCCIEELKLIKLPLIAGGTTLLIIAEDATPLPLATINQIPVIANASKSGMAFIFVIK
jgi:hypothetical protein